MLWKVNDYKYRHTDGDLIIIIIIIKSLFNEDSLLKTYQIQTYSACNIEMSLYTTRSSTKQWKNW